MSAGPTLSRWCKSTSFSIDGSSRPLPGALSGTSDRPVPGRPPELMEPRSNAHPDWDRLRAVLHQEADHYEILDRRLVGRLAGFLFCCAGLIAAVLLAVDAPTDTLGPLGWAPAAAIILLAFAVGAG